MRTLDHGIDTLGCRPVRKLDPPVRAALRTGAYQLAYMDAVPPHAAVHETVELVRAAGLERAVPFTNAVMRRLAEGPVLDGLHEETPAAALFYTKVRKAALGLPVEDLGAEWPEYRHPQRPEFLLTLPHVHRTTGFFVARLRA